MSWQHFSIGNELHKTLYGDRTYFILISSPHQYDDKSLKSIPSFHQCDEKSQMASNLKYYVNWSQNWCLLSLLNDPESSLVSIQHHTYQKIRKRRENLSWINIEFSSRWRKITGWSWVFNNLMKNHRNTSITRWSGLKYEVDLSQISISTKHHHKRWYTV